MASSSLLCILLICLSAASTSGEQPRDNANSGDRSRVCPDDLGLAVDDDTLADADWRSEIIENSAAPDNPWDLDFALQSFDTGIVQYPPAGNPPPGRWLRLSYGGSGNLGANVESASLYARNIVPEADGLEAIQFDFDNWATNATVGPMVLQAGTYYRGPSFTAVRTDGWTAYSSRCLTANDFVKRAGPGPDRPDFTQPMTVGYTVGATTSRTLRPPRSTHGQLQGMG